MNTWRILKIETHNAAMNMAIDEAILLSRVAKKVPNTLRFYLWEPSAVSIGRFQKPENEVNLENCEKLGVDVVRRISGGGTVYHDSQGELTYSVVAKTEDMGAKDITEVYSSIYHAISEALGMFGVVTDFSPGDAKNCPNLTVKGKKISGSSQTITRGIVLQHGTLLRSVDLPKMFKLLKLENVSCTQAADIASRKITSIQNELGHSISADTVANAIAQGFQIMLKIHLEPGELTSYEQKLANKLYKEKYSSKEWVFDGKLN